GIPATADHERSRQRHSPYKSRQGARFPAGGRSRMTTETEAPRERLRPRILETEETGRLELNLPPPPEAHLPAPRTQRSRSPLRAATQAFAINAISPTALLDTLLFAARALRLIREIAEIYGQRPGLAGTVHLLRRLASGAGMVGAVDLAGGILVQQLGGAVMERLSASAAESAYAAQK